MTVAQPPADRDASLAGLLSRVARSDQRAFGELYDGTAAHLYGVALRILRSPAAAEEILQEAFVSIWQYARSFEAARSRPLIWLTSIVRNRCIDRLRAQQIGALPLAGDEEVPDSGLPPDAVRPAEIPPESADTIHIHACVRALDAGPRRALELAFHQGSTHAELARQLREPPGTVKAWVREALGQVKACVDRADASRTE